MRRTAVAGLALLLLVGIVPATARTIDSVRYILEPDPSSPGLRGSDRLVVPLYVRMRGGTPGSPEAQPLLDEFDGFLGKFGRHPWATLAHVGPGLLLFLLAPLQFVSSFRRRYRRFHRWSGRIIVGCVAPITGAAFYYGIVRPYGGLAESTGVAFFGALFVYAAARGFIAIRARHIAEHREWMTRMFGIALGIAVQRVITTPVGLFWRVSPSVWFGASVWVAFGLSTLAAELYVLRQRKSGALGWRFGLVSTAGSEGAT